MPHNWIVVQNTDNPDNLAKKLKAVTDDFKNKGGNIKSVEFYWDIHMKDAYVWVDGPADVKEIKALAWALEAKDVITVLKAGEARDAFKTAKGANSKLT